MSSLNALQTEQVRTKVLYSEVDIPFNGYLDVLNRVTKLTRSVLDGGLQSYEAKEGITFSADYVKGLEQNVSLQYLELQSSIDVKKLAQENWEQSNNDTITAMENSVPGMNEKLRDANSRLEERIERIRGLYDSVGKVNAETENLLEGNASLTTTRSEWEKELGSPLTEKLIKQGYMRKVESSEGVERYRVHDNFTKGPKELRHINQSIRSDISRLTEELATYKSRWLEDANVFSRITSALKEELIKRNMNVDMEMDEEEEDEEEEEEEEAEEEEAEEELEEEDEELAEEDLDGEDLGELQEEEEEEVGAEDGAYNDIETQEALKDEEDEEKESHDVQEENYAQEQADDIHEEQDHEMGGTEDSTIVKDETQADVPAASIGSNENTPQPQLQAKDMDR